MISRRFILRSALLAGLVACGHGEPFGTGIYTPGTPAGSGALVRLTFNLGKDRTPAWLPDGSGIVYSFEREDRPDRDHCLGRLPAPGGAVTRVDCVTTVEADDSLDVLEEPAVAADGRIAYILSSASLFPVKPLAPDADAIVVGSLSDPLTVRVLQPIVYTAPSGRQHYTVLSLRWLDANRLVYVGGTVVYPLVCVGCQVRDTIDWGLEIVVLDFAGPTPGLTVVPGTDGASSVTPGATPDTIYWTKNGDSRVYRTALTSGITDTAYDFGPGEIARDVDVVGSKLAAVVGGNVASFVDPSFGLLQVDGGGFLHMVDLVANTDTTLGDPNVLIRRPALAPSGRSIVVETQPPSKLSDLWLVAVP